MREAKKKKKKEEEEAPQKQRIPFIVNIKNTLLDMYINSKGNCYVLREDENINNSFPYKIFILVLL